MILFGNSQLLGRSSARSDASRELDSREKGIIQVDILTEELTTTADVLYTKWLSEELVEMGLDKGNKGGISRTSSGPMGPTIKR